MISHAIRLMKRTTDGTVSFAHIGQSLFDPKYAGSGKPNETAFNIASGSDVPFFEWLSKPENAAQNKKWATAMNGFDQFTAQDVILKGKQLDIMHRQVILMNLVQRENAWN